MHEASGMSLATTPSRVTWGDMRSSDAMKTGQNGMLYSNHRKRESEELKKTQVLIEFTRAWRGSRIRGRDRNRVQKEN